MQIFRTDENGEINISVNDKGKILVKKFVNGDGSFWQLLHATIVKK